MRCLTDATATRHARPPRRARRAALCLAAWLGVGAPGHGQASPSPLPDFGDPSATVLTPQAERQIGEALLARLRQQGVLLEDLQVVDYVESLGARLAMRSSLGPASTTFFVVRDGSINAFAAPGGMIGIHTGLILASDSESELAAVIAHEIAHISQRHMARTFEAAGRMQLPMAVGILAALLLGQVDAEVGQAALAGTLAGSQQQQIDFIRTNEEEADRIGIQVLADAGFDPLGMPRFFAKLQRNQRLYGDALPEFLRTHPVNVSRIASAEERAGSLPPPRLPDPTDYRLTRLRVEVLTTDNAEALAGRLEQRRNAGDREAGYGLALLQIKRGRGGDALQTLAPLLEQDGDRPEYLAARAEALAGSGALEQATEVYRSALAIYPGQRALTLGYAQLLLNRGQAATVQQLLQAELAAGRATRAVHLLLAEASAKQGRRLEAHLQRAEWLLLDGRTEEAADELRRALAEAPDANDYLAAKVAARLAEIEAKLLAQAPRPPQ
ncbi:MAG TPA: M48 family metalloprotease [Gammaproteobacteria bacterium]